MITARRAAASKAHSSHGNAPRPDGVFRDSTAVAEIGTWPELSPIHLSSLEKSRAVCQRSSGFFARLRRMARSRLTGVNGLIELSGGGSLSRIAEATLNGVLPSKARLPVSISYKTAPKEKMSLRPSSSCHCTCSGDMYWKVPTMVPSWVMGECGDAEVMVARLASG